MSSYYSVDSVTYDRGPVIPGDSMDWFDLYYIDDNLYPYYYVKISDELKALELYEQ